MDIKSFRILFRSVSMLKVSTSETQFAEQKRKLESVCQKVNQNINTSPGKLHI